MALTPIPRRDAPFQVFQGPEYEANTTAPLYLFHLSEDEKYWLLMRSKTIEYVSQRVGLENAPPSTGEKRLPADKKSLACVGPGGGCYQQALTEGV